MAKSSLFSDIMSSGASSGPRCGVTRISEVLTDEDRQALEAALSNVQLTHAQISRGLRTNGYTVSAGTISRHRAGDCACGRGE